MRYANLEHQEAKSRHLTEYAAACGWLENCVGMFADLTKPEVVLVICYADKTKRRLPWSVHGEDAKKFILDMVM